MKFSFSQKFWLVALRMAIGWHFLYEGVSKLTNANWSSVGYLLDSEGFMKEFFINITAHPNLLGIVDQVNIWGLILIGLSLIFGLFSQYATIAGVILLSFYYLSHPPFIGMRFSAPSEGSYLIVNKVLIELIALALLYVFPTNKEFGLDHYIFRENHKS